MTDDELRDRIRTDRCGCMYVESKYRNEITRRIHRGYRQRLFEALRAQGVAVADDDYGRWLCENRDWCVNPAHVVLCKSGRGDLYEYDGRKLPVSEWAKEPECLENGITLRLLRERIAWGWPIRKAVTTLGRGKKRKTMRQHGWLYSGVRVSDGKQRRAVAAGETEGDVA